MVGVGIEHRTSRAPECFKLTNDAHHRHDVRRTELQRLVGFSRLHRHLVMDQYDQRRHAPNCLRDERGSPDRAKHGGQIPRVSWIGQQLCKLCSGMSGAPVVFLLHAAKQIRRAYFVLTPGIRRLRPLCSVPRGGAHVCPGLLDIPHAHARSISKHYARTCLACGRA